MTKFDIRLRRKQFTHSRIERHKNYQSLMERHYEARKKKTRGIMVLVFLVIMIIAILLAFFGTVDEPRKDTPENKIGMRMKLDKIESIDKTATDNKH